MCCFHSLFHDCLWVANRSQACLMSNDSIYHFLYPNALFYDCLSLFWYAGNMWMCVRGKSTLCMYTFSKNCWMFFFSFCTVPARCLPDAFQCRIFKTLLVYIFLLFPPVLHVYTRRQAIGWELCSTENKTKQNKAVLIHETNTKTVKLRTVSLFWSHMTWSHIVLRTNV